MKFLKITMACAVALAFAAGPLTMSGAEEKESKTCCEQKANEKSGGTDCTHKCCIEAHNAGKSCEKCNPKKQDEKYLKKTDAKKEEKK